MLSSISGNGIPHGNDCDDGIIPDLFYSSLSFMMLFVEICSQTNFVVFQEQVYLC